MRALAVSVNGKRLATGGVEDGVLAANISSMNSSQKPKGRALVGVLLGGFDTAANERLEWVQKSLRVGDEVCISRRDRFNRPTPPSKAPQCSRGIERTKATRAAACQEVWVDDSN
jgi:hypothetical protein